MGASPSPRSDAGQRSPKSPDTVASAEGLRLERATEGVIDKADERNKKLAPPPTGRVFMT